MNDFELGKKYFLEGLEYLQSLNFEAAVVQFKKSLAEVPDRVSTLVNLSSALIQMYKYQEAEETLKKLASLDQNIADLWLNFGLISRGQGNLERAIEHFDAALQIDPSMADAFLNKAFALLELNKYELAFTAINQSIKLNKNSAAALNCKGQILASLKRNEESVQAYQTAFLIDPNFKFILGSLIHAKMHICDWGTFDQTLNSLAQNISSKKKSSTPFPILSLLDDPKLHQIAAEIYTASEHLNKNISNILHKNAANSKIRIGYFSTDFRQHAVAQLMAEVFELHDKERFEIIAFSLGPKTNDEMQQRLSKAFKQFIHVQNKSDIEIVNLSRELAIDIAIDLNGFTTGYRANIFSQRASPIQVNYLGYPSTMGADYIDYIIGDSVVTPPKDSWLFTEKIALMRHCYQANDRNRIIPKATPSREDMGFGENQFVFCCFNNNYKITPATFSIWMKILKKVDNSVLWLLQDNASASKNLQIEAEKRGVNAERLIFANRMDLPLHLARHKCADLFLDTFPYNAHTTASDALWAGLPVLTMMGESFASRVAASLLTAIGLPELITHTPEEYEALAIELAMDREKLQSIKEKLWANRLTTPLFDSKSFTQNLEEIYLRMYERYQSGLLPCLIDTNQ